MMIDMIVAALALLMAWISRARAALTTIYDLVSRVHEYVSGLVALAGAVHAKATAS